MSFLQCSVSGCILDTPRVFWADRSCGPPVDSCIRRELRMILIEELVQKGARSCAVVLPATSASGAAWLAWSTGDSLRRAEARLFRFLPSNSPLLELEVLEHTCEIKHVIEQHRAHHSQIAAQDLERQANAWCHRNLTQTFAFTLCSGTSSSGWTTRNSQAGSAYFP